MKYVDYREKLGLGFNDKTKTTMFFNKIIQQSPALFKWVSNIDFQAEMLYINMYGVDLNDLRMLGPARISYWKIQGFP